jgi:hypothetical protein
MAEAAILLPDYGRAHGGYNGDYPPSGRNPANMGTIEKGVPSGRH